MLLGYLQDDEFVGLEAMFSESGRSLFSVKVLSTEIEYFELDSHFQSFLSLHKLKQTLVQGLSFKLAYRLDYLAKKLDYSSVKKAAPHKVEGFSAEVASHKLLKQMELEAAGWAGTGVLKAPLDAKKSKFLEKFTRTQDPGCQINQLFLETRSIDKLTASPQRSLSIGSLEPRQPAAPVRERDSPTAARLQAEPTAKSRIDDRAPGKAQHSQDPQTSPSLHSRFNQQARALEQHLRPSQGYFISNFFRKPPKQHKSNLQSHFRPKQSVGSELSPQRDSPEHSMLPAILRAEESSRQSLEQISAFPDERFLANFKKAVKDFSRSKALFLPACQLESSCIVERKVAVSALRAVQAPKSQSLNTSHTAEGLKVNLRIKSPGFTKKHGSAENLLLVHSVSKQQLQSSKALHLEANQMATSLRRRHSSSQQLS